VLTGVLLVSGRSEVFAQVTVSGAIGVITAVQPDVEPVTPSTVSGVGGTAFSVTLGVTGHVVSRLSVGLEMTLPDAFDFHTGTVRGGPISGTFRDIIFSGPIVKVRLIGPIEAVAGVSIVKKDLVATLRLPSVGVNPGPPVPIPIQNSPGLAVGVVMGADVAVPTSPRVVIAPGIRLHLIQRNSVETSEIGLGSAVVQGGVAVRVVF
jgi:hypothetical protein